MKVLMIIVLILLGLVLIPNLYMRIKTTGRIYDSAASSETKDAAEVILVLGAAAWGSSPSPILADRLDKAVEVYNELKIPVLLSGDGIEDYYSETAVMKAYMVEAGIPEEDILIDDYGLSTYESLRRAAEEYGYKNIIIISQQYHLYRAVYIGEYYGMTCTGISAEHKLYSSSLYNEVREILARDKDIIKCWLIKKNIVDTWI